MTTYTKPPRPRKFTDHSLGLSVYSGQQFDGSVREADGQWIAYDVNGVEVGAFPSMQAAMLGLYLEESRS